MANDQDIKKRSINPVAAGALGALAGAAAVIFMQEENRKKVGNAIGDLKAKSRQKLYELKTRTEEIKAKTKAKIEEAAGNARAKQIPIERE